jgi:hypothetical protein
MYRLDHPPLIQRRRWLRLVALVDPLDPQDRAVALAVGNLGTASGVVRRAGTVVPWVSGMTGLTQSEVIRSIDRLLVVGLLVPKGSTFLCTLPWPMSALRQAEDRVLALAHS